MPRAVSADRLEASLASLVGRYDRRFLDTDPLGVVRRFQDPDDREVAALIAAALAYGRVASIRKSLEAVFAATGPRPARFVDAFDPRRDARRFDGFAHRFHRGADLALFVWLIAQARRAGGGLEGFFLAGDDAEPGATIERPLDAFGRRLLDLDASPFFAAGRVPAGHAVRFFVPRPSAGSVCKRPCLFLRWMVRPDDGVDCGVWTRVAPARLVLPLDTHLVRVVKGLGWTRRASPGWAMALEATAHLRRLDPADPVRFDFALSRLGILGLIPAPGGRLSRLRVERAMRAAAEAP